MIATFIKYTLGESWNMTFFINNHKILCYFNYETESKFLILTIFPAAQHDNTVLNSNVITDHH